MRQLNAAAFREWLTEYHGTDFGAPDEVLDAYLEQALAFIRAGGRGGLYGVAAEKLREAHDPPPQDVLPEGLYPR